MENVKLVICDIDSTLIEHHKPMTQRTKDDIAKLRAKGIRFGIASGRSPEEIVKLAGEQWKVDFDLAIGYNGSQMWDLEHDKKYNFFDMKKEWMYEAYEIMKPFESNTIVMSGGVFNVTAIDDMMREASRVNGLVYKVIDDIDELLSKPAVKIMFRLAHAEDMPLVEKYISTIKMDGFRNVKTQPTMMEFTNALSSKGYALEKYCEETGLPLENVVAFGDTTNDNEMLEVAGCGVCLLNGSDDTKAIADYITEKTCTEDGWADFVEKHIL